MYSSNINLQVVDLLGLVNGGVFMSCSEPGAGDCRNLIKCGMAETLNDGWEVLPKVGVLCSF